MDAKEFKVLMDAYLEEHPENKNSLPKVQKTTDDAIRRVENHSLSTPPTFYPFKYGQRGEYVSELAKAISNIYISPDIILKNNNYGLSTVIRKSSHSEIGIFRIPKVGDGKAVLIQNWAFPNDPANGSTQLLDSTNVKVLINWDALPNEFAVTDLISEISGNYELDDFCFSLKNPFAASSSSIEGNQDGTLSNSSLFYAEIPLITGGFVDIVTGKRVENPYFAHTDYIPVYPGQAIEYEGCLFAYASICGYSSENDNKFFPIRDASDYTDAENRKFKFIVPPNVKYVRASIDLRKSSKIIFRYNDSYNYALVKSNGEEGAKLKSLDFQGGQVESSFLTVESQLQETKWLKLKYNRTFPTKGVFIGRQGNDVVISVNGVITKLNS